MQDYSQLESALRDRLSELRARIAKAEAELDQPGDPDVEEQASMRQNDEVTEAVEDAAIEEISQIEAALARLANGLYGRCAACGAELPIERLRAIPHASRCAPCA